MISVTAEYALRSAIFLAMNREKAFTVQEIADVTKVPAPYLSKVLQSLVKAGIVHSQRGIRGGFVLAMEPENISILNVVNRSYAANTDLPLGTEVPRNESVCATCGP